MCTLGSNFNCCTALGKSLSVCFPITSINECQSPPPPPPQCSVSLAFFWTHKNGLNVGHFEKIAHRIVRSKPSWCLKWMESPIISLFRWDKTFLSKFVVQTLSVGCASSRIHLLFCKLEFVSLFCSKIKKKTKIEREKSNRATWAERSASDRTTLFTEYLLQSLVLFFRGTVFDEICKLEHVRNYLIRLIFSKCFSHWNIWSLFQVQSKNIWKWKCKIRVFCKS